MTRNISWLSFANLLVKPLWFVFITAICMRILGVEGYGLFAASLALATIFASISDLGTCDYTIREVSRAPGLGTHYFTNLGVGRLVIALVVGVITLLSGLALGYGGNALQAVGWAVVYALSLRLCEFCRAFYRAYERLAFEAASLISEKVVVIGSGMAFLLTYEAAHMALFGLAVGMMITLVMNIAMVHLRFSRLDLRRVDYGFVMSAITSSFPIGLYLIFSMGLLHVGVVMLDVISGPVAAGNFAPPQRLLEGLVLIPGIAAAALLPRLSSLFHNLDVAGFAATFRRGVAVLIGISLVSAIALSLGAPVFISLLASDEAFERAVSVLTVLAWAYPLMCMQYVSSIALIASDQHRALSGIMAIGVVAMIMGSFALIPFYLEMGVTAAFIASYMLVSLLSFWHLRWTFRPVDTASRASS